MKLRCFRQNDWTRTRKVMEEYSNLMNSSAKPEWIPPEANHPGNKIHFETVKQGYQSEFVYHKSANFFSPLKPLWSDI